MSRFYDDDDDEDNNTEEVLGRGGFGCVFNPQLENYVHQS